MHLKDIEPSGLQSPIWSPDGQQIITSYDISSMSGIIAIFTKETRHDLISIDTDTWKETILASQKTGGYFAQTWLPDGKGYAIGWSDGYGEYGIYLFDLNGNKLMYLSEYGALSPDTNKLANYDKPFVTIKDIHSQDVVKFTVPVEGIWYVNSWSPDMKHLVLTYRENKSDDFDAIFLLDVATGLLKQFTNDETSYKYSPTISPNNQFIAYSEQQNTKTKLIIATLNQSCKWTIPIDNIYQHAWSPDNTRIFLVGTDGVYVADLDTVIDRDLSGQDSCQ